LYKKYPNDIDVGATCSDVEAWVGERVKADRSTAGEGPFSVPPDGMLTRHKPIRFF
jgi:hypothetical protein